MSRVALAVKKDCWESPGRQQGVPVCHDAWIEMLLSYPAECLVKNMSTHWAVLRIDDTEMPTTINDAQYDNSYVCSPYTGCILYPESEVKKLDHAALRWFILAIVRTLGPLLRAAQINRVVCVNNWLLSTNLYSNFDVTQIPEVTRTITKCFPKHAIAFRSLNETTNRPLLEQLRSDGYLLAPSRQVYFFDGKSGDYLHKQDNRRDAKLFATTTYQIVQHEQLQPEDAKRIEQLYRWLYIDKYSEHNPQFSAEMIEQCRLRGLLRLWALRTDDGRLDGVVGTFTRDGVMTAPVVGYDTSLPQHLGLYRMLMSIVLQEAAKAKLTLNLSSGASHFKRIRGGVASLEYTAVYCRHLPFVRRLAWQTLATLTQKVAAPILRKYEL